MATNTPNLNLRKPDGVDLVDVTLDLNNNWVKVDNTFTNSAPIAFAINGSSGAGSLMIVARADHIHGGPGFGTPVAVGQSNSSGVLTTVARADHVHQHRDKLIALDTWFPMDPIAPQLEFFYLPYVATVLRLSLIAQIGIASGPLPAHTHTITDGPAVATGSESAFHTHNISFVSASYNVDHTHSATTTANGSHTPTGTGSTGAGSSHDHAVSGSTGAGTAHEHIMKVKNTAGADPSLDSSATAASDNTNYIDTESAHTHPAGSLDVAAEAAHTHSVSITMDAVADHQHTITTGGSSVAHTHAVVGVSDGENQAHTHVVALHSHTGSSAGQGGYDTYRYPKSVTVDIDGVNRTVALGGPFGPSGGFWTSLDMDIQPYVSGAGWHYVGFSTAAASGGRLRAHIYAEG